MEGIREQLVSRPRLPEDGIKKVIIMAAGVTLGVLVLLLLNAFGGALGTMFGVLIAIGIIWGAWYLMGNLNVEYEYIIADGEMTVDKITNKRSRKTLCSLKLRSAEAFRLGEIRDDNASVIDVCGDGDRYSILYNDDKFGRAVLLFTPDGRTLEAVKPYLPRLS